MEYLKSFFSGYFNSVNLWQATLEGLLFVIGIYGLFKIILFFLRYYIIYQLAKKLALLWAKIRPKKYNTTPSNKEDERLRDERKERQQKLEDDSLGAEQVTVDRIEEDISPEEIEKDFKIIFPKVTGKWQQLILQQRKDVIIEVAKRMYANKSTNYWTTLLEVQRERERLIKNPDSNRFR